MDMTDEYDYSGMNTTIGGSSDPQPAAPSAGSAPFTATASAFGQREASSAFADEGFTVHESDTQAYAAQPEPAQPEPETAPTEPTQPEPESAPTETAQPEPETVQAEPAPQYAASGSYYGGAHQAPPYGRSANAYGYSNVYGTQPPYGAPPTYGTQTQAPYGAPQQPAATPEKQDKKGLKIFFRVLVGCVIVLLTAAVIWLAKDRVDSKQASTDNGTTAVTAAANAPEMETKASPSSDSQAVAGKALTPTQIAAKVRASSVGILVYSGNSSGATGQGSGVLWKEDGTGAYTYIITCAHVVSGSGYTYSVQTEDSQTFDAELIGADAKTDLAVLRIKKTGLSLAEFGDSSSLQVGDPVYAIGNPGGTEFFGSFTSGIVSAIDRSVKNTYTMVCIQHTAAINPGNSGGALVNQYGQVIGINSQKISSTEYEGMGFAIPIKSAQSTINALSSYGYVKDRPKLGITYAEALNYQQYSMIIKLRGLPSGSLVISQINSDSSLANTNVKSGDMIIKVNGEDMTTPNVLLDKIENGKVGDKLTLTIYRVDNNYNPTEFTVTATLVEDKPQSQQETTTQQQYFDPYDFFNRDFGEFFGGN